MRTEMNLADKGKATDTMPIVVRNYFSSHLLFSAKRLADLAKQMEDRHTGTARFDHEHRAYVLSSIVSAVGFLEAMINELFQDAYDGHAPVGGAITPLSTSTRQLMAEYWRAIDLGERKRILDKYQALLRFASQPVMEEGQQPFQHAWLAVQLRNAIVHFRPEDLSADEPAKMETRLRRKFPDNRLMAGAATLGGQTIVSGGDVLTGQCVPLQR
jgi:hypothetical protein